MKTFVFLVAATAVLAFALSATADLGAVHVFTRCDEEMTDEVERELLDRIAAAHMRSPLAADHFHFLIEVNSYVDPGLRDDGYFIGRYSHEYNGTDHGPLYKIAGKLAGVRNAVAEIEKTFDQGTLYRLKSSWRDGPVRKPLLNAPQP